MMVAVSKQQDILGIAVPSEHKKEANTSRIDTSPRHAILALALLTQIYRRMDQYVCMHA